MPVRHWLPAALLLALTPFTYGETLSAPACADACAAEPACGENVFHESWADDCSECCAPLWTFRAGAIYLDRSAPTGGAALFAANAPLNFAPQLGFDFNARRRGGDCHFVECRYFGVNDFSAADDTVLAVGFTSTRFDSQLQSVELNLYRDSQAWWSALAGFRYVGFDERAYTITTLGVPRLELDSVTTNRLYGGQVGVEALLLHCGRVSVDGYVKAGLYYNNAGLTSSTRILNGPWITLADGTDHAAFVGDLGVTGVYQWTERIAFRGGLQLLWLDRVAEAGNQGFAGFVPLNSGGSVFYYGGTGAVEVKF